ncbi:MAG: hypothetical protein WCO71_05275 [Pseudomonadota bacterium]
MNLRSLIFKLINALLCLVFLTGCSYQSFHYSATDPVRIDPLDKQKQGREFYGLGKGFVWSGCSAVNQQAIDDLLRQAQGAGYDAVSDLFWYDYQHGSWVKEPTCLTELGWLAGLIYTFWMPGATKVQVKATAIMKGAHSDLNDIFHSKTVGSELNNSEKIRQTHMPKLAVAQVLEAGMVVGVGLRVGHFVDHDTRWTATLKLETIFHDPPYRYCNRRRVQGWATLAVRRETFIGNSFYYGLGPAIQQQDWAYNSCECLDNSPDVSTHQPAVKKRLRQYGLIGVDAGIGNEWRSPFGLFGGCEWLGGFLGIKVWQRGDEFISGDNYPYRFIPRVVTCHLGYEF